MRCIKGIARARVLVHEPHQKVLVETAPVDADAHRLAVLDRALDHHRELRIVFRAFADVARIDPILRQRTRALRKIREQLVSVVVKVSDQRNGAAEPIETIADRRNGRRRVRGIDGDANELRARVGERLDLRYRRGDVDRVGIGHRLNDDRSAAPDGNAAHQHRSGSAAQDRRALERVHRRASRFIPASSKHRARSGAARSPALRDDLLLIAAEWKAEFEPMTDRSCVRIVFPGHYAISILDAPAVAARGAYTAACADGVRSGMLPLRSTDRRCHREPVVCCALGFLLTTRYRLPESRL